MKSGNWKFTKADGSSYEGQFYEYNINGNGIYTWDDGRKYIGSQLNNKMDGQGVYTCPVIENIKEIIKKRKKKVMEFLNGVMEGNIKVYGKMKIRW